MKKHLTEKNNLDSLYETIPCSLEEQQVRWSKFVGREITTFRNFESLEAGAKHYKSPLIQDEIRRRQAFIDKLLECI